MIATYLRTGSAAGLLAGLLAGIFAFGEPRLDRAVVQEKADSVRAHDGAAPQHEGSGMVKLANPPGVGDSVHHRQPHARCCTVQRFATIEGKGMKGGMMPDQPDYMRVSRRDKIPGAI